MADTPTPAPQGERRMGALSHLGVPLYGPLLPLALFNRPGASAFRRDHASTSFSFQCAFIVVWLVLLTLALGGLISWVVLPLVLLAVLLVELPNVVRALKGEPPLRIVPFTFLSA